MWKPEELQAIKKAKEAIRYPVLYQARKIGRVLQVSKDGSGTRGIIREESSGCETFIPQTLPCVIRLDITNDVCPESYRAYCDDHLIGFLRLRDYFRVDYIADTPDWPKTRGETIYSCQHTKGNFSFTNNERDYFLDLACALLYERHFCED